MVAVRSLCRLKHIFENDHGNGDICAIVDGTDSRSRGNGGSTLAISQHPPTPPALRKGASKVQFREVAGLGQASGQMALQMCFLHKATDLVGSL